VFEVPVLPGFGARPEGTLWAVMLQYGFSLHDWILPMIYNTSPAAQTRTNRFHMANLKSKW